MGVSLYDLMNKYIFIPCGIGINSFPFQTFIQSEPDLPKGVINDPAARYAFDHGHLLGSAGLFMSAGHLLKIVKIMLGDSGFLKPETFEGLSRGEFPDFGRGLPIWSAFRKNLEHFAIDDPTGHHKLGHTGCILATFRGSGFGFVALTDYLFDNPRADNRHLLYQFFASLSGAVRFEMVGS